MKLITTAVVTLATGAISQEFGNSISIGGQDSTNTYLPLEIQENVAEAAVHILEAIAAAKEESEATGAQGSDPSANTGGGERTISLQSGGGLTQLPQDIFNVPDEYFITEEEDESGNTNGPRRWTDDSRPWTKNYSQFRRSIKVLLNETINARPHFTHGPGGNMGPNAVDNNGRQTNFPLAVNTIPKMLRNYGCWCMPRGDRDWANGHGHHVDEVDKVCKGFGHCLTCTQIENTCYKIEDETYKHSIDWNGERMVLKCKDNIPEDMQVDGKVDCLKLSCECHAHYIDQIVEMALTSLENDVQAWTFESYGGYLDTAKVIDPKHSQKGKYNGNFEFDTCKAGQFRSNQNMITHTPEHCCGSHPTWKVYDSKSGTRNCCGTSVFENWSNFCTCALGSGHAEDSCEVKPVVFDQM